MKIIRNELNFLIGMDFFVLFLFLVSHPIKRMIVYPLFNLGFIIVIIPIFILCSILFIVGKRSFFVVGLQALTCCFFILMIHFSFPQRFALFIELPKIEKEIKELKKNGELTHSQIVGGYYILPDKEYIIFEWEQGFLDNQIVLIYDEKDELRNIDLESERKFITQGKLEYVIFRAKKCFYLCIIYR